MLFSLSSRLYPTAVLSAFTLSFFAAAPLFAQDAVNQATSGEKANPLEKTNTATLCKMRYGQSGTHSANLDTQSKLGTQKLSRLKQDEKGKQSDIVLTAETAKLDENDVLVLNGDVVVTDGERELQADSIRYEQAQQKLTLDGKVSVIEDDLILKGEGATFNQTTGAAEIDSASYLIPSTGVRGESGAIERGEDQQIQLNDGSYTSCPPGDNSWQVSAKDIKLNPEEGFGKAYHALIRIKDVPVFYFPYLEFPIDDRRKSGFLIPSISSGDDGLDLALPYYLNLAPNYDMTLVPRLITGRGLLNQAEARYLNTWSEWVTSGAYLDKDKKRSDFDRDDQTRWLGSIEQTGQINEHWETDLSYTRVSDTAYFYDLGNVGLDVKSSSLITQQANIRYRKQDWAFSALLQDFQSLDPTLDQQYALQPRLTLAHQPFDTPFELKPTLFTQFTAFDDEVKPRGQRLYLEPGVKYPMQWQAGFINLHAKVKHLSYRLSEEFSTEGETTTAWQGGIDGGLFFERQGNQKYNHTLEPRIGYLYTQKQEQSNQPLFDTTELPFSYQHLFRDTRFSGYDRISDANQITLSVTSRWWQKRGGQQVGRISIGQQFYLSDRIVTINDASTLNTLDTRKPDWYTRASSPLTGITELSPNAHHRFYFDWVFNSHQNQMNQASLLWQWQDKGHLFNIGYRFNRIDDDPALIALNTITNDQRDLLDRDRILNQVDLSGLYQITPSVSVLGRFRYDIEDHSSLEHLLGVEYDSCCWKTRLVYQRERESFNVNAVSNSSALAQAGALQYDNAIFLQIELKGLGNIAGSVNNLLEESILGFRQREAKRQ